jgi:hypothetical protein
MNERIVKIDQKRRGRRTEEMVDGYWKEIRSEERRR